MLNIFSCVFWPPIQHITFRKAFIPYHALTLKLSHLIFTRNLWGWYYYFYSEEEKSKLRSKITYLLSNSCQAEVACVRINICLFYQRKSWLLHFFPALSETPSSHPLFPLFPVTICFKLANQEECVPWPDQWEGDRYTTCVRGQWGGGVFLLHARFLSICTLLKKWRALLRSPCVHVSHFPTLKILAKVTFPQHLWPGLLISLYSLSLKASHYAITDTARG